MKFIRREFSNVKDFDVSRSLPESFEEQARLVIDILYGYNTIGVNDTRARTSLGGIEWLTNETD